MSCPRLILNEISVDIGTIKTDRVSGRPVTNIWQMHATLWTIITLGPQIKNDYRMISRRLYDASKNQFLQMACELTIIKAGWHI